MSFMNHVISYFEPEGKPFFDEEEMIPEEEIKFIKQKEELYINHFLYTQYFS